jgi:hypothetical protein
MDRIIDGATQNSTVWTDMLRATNDRAHRFNRLLIDEAERTQDERGRLFRELAARPTAISDFTRELFQTWERRARRRMELARTMMDDLRDMGASTRSLYERMRDANRQTATAAARAGRNAVATVAEEAAERAEDAGERAEGIARDLRN